MLIYYLANKDYMEEGKIIDNLNELYSVSNRYFSKENIKEFEREVFIVVEESVKLMKQKLSKINAFYTEINELPFSNKPEDIERTLEMEETEIEIFIRDGEYPFDIDSGDIIFDNMKTNNYVAMIVYISLFETYYYKIRDGREDISEIMEEEYKIEDKKPNHIYFFISVMDGDIKKNKMIDIDLTLSKMTFSYPGNTLGQVKDIVKKIFPDIVFIDEKKTSLKGTFEIDFKNFSEIRVRYLTLFDKMFSNFIYINENASPRSLKKNTKYYFKTYDDRNTFSNHSVSFNLLPIYSNRYIVDFRTRIIQQSSVNEFILTISKLISYYQNVNFEDTLIGIIEEKYIGEEKSVIVMVSNKSKTLSMENHSLEFDSEDKKFIWTPSGDDNFSFLVLDEGENIEIFVREYLYCEQSKILPITVMTFSPC